MNAHLCSFVSGMNKGCSVVMAARCREETEGLAMKAVDGCCIHERRLTGYADIGHVQRQRYSSRMEMAEVNKEGSCI
jgi:hypothetical protein